MNYIKQLQSDLEQTRHSLNDAEEGLAYILTYLGSEKFQGIENNWVNASEMYGKIREISNIVSQAK